MKNIHFYIIIALLLSTSILGFVVVSKNKAISDCENKETVIEKDKIKKINDSILNLYQNKIKAYERKIDSLAKLKQQIKYVPYEKYYYSDRNVDTALDIISNYQYDTRARSSKK